MTTRPIYPQIPIMIQPPIELRHICASSHRNVIIEFGLLRYLLGDGDSELFFVAGDLWFAWDCAEGFGLMFAPADVEE